MVSIARHGRLQRISRIAIFITGMSTLMIGGIMSVSSFHQEQQNAQLNINQNLKTQAQILVDQFFTVIETVKSGADLTNLTYVTHRGTVKLDQGLPTEIESLDFIQQDKTGNAPAPAMDLALDERVLRALKKQISVQDLHYGQAVIGTFEMTEVGSKEGIFYVTPINSPEVQPAQAPVQDSASTGVVSATTIAASAEAVNVVNNAAANNTLPVNHGTATLVAANTSPVITTAGGSATTAVTHPGHGKIEKLSIVLIDPVKALASLTKLANAQSESDQHAFLMNSHGKILAHTLPAYVGTDLTKMDTLKETIGDLFLGAQTGTVTRYKAIDGDREQIALVRTGAYPFAIGVEQKALSSVMSAAWLMDQASSGAARKNLGLILILFAGALVMMSAVSLWFGRELQRSLQPEANQAENQSGDEWAMHARATAPITFQKHATRTSSAPAFVAGALTDAPSAQAPAPSGSFSFALENDEAASAADQFVESHTHLSEELRNSHVQAGQLATMTKTEKENTQVIFSNPASGIAEFGARMANAFTIEAVERELVDATSKVAESPVLYFRYHKRNQNLVLAAAAGSVQIQNHSVMQVYVRKDIEQQIENFSNEGKVASVSNYGPIAKMMISNLNVAHFEAWAVTSDRSVNSNGSQLVGVLVVLQAGFKSAEARPVLGKMIREAGNYLYAQNSKLRSSITQSATHAPQPGAVGSATL